MKAIRSGKAFTALALLGLLAGAVGTADLARAESSQMRRQGTTIQPRSKSSGFKDEINPQPLPPRKNFQSHSSGMKDDINPQPLPPKNQNR